MTIECHLLWGIRVMNLTFLPGASGNTAFWQDVIQYLTLEIETTVIAFPSFGGHPNHVGVKSFEDLQHYVLGQIQQDSVLIAQSMGGIFAVQAALQQPEQVRALVLVATSGGIDLSAFEVADWRKDDQLNFTVPDWFVQHRIHLDAALEKISCPVLLIWGDSDLISPVAIGQYLHENIVHSELYVIENGQHDLAQVYAEQVSVLIENFLIRKIKNAQS